MTLDSSRISKLLKIFNIFLSSMKLLFRFKLHNFVIDHKNAWYAWGQKFYLSMYILFIQTEQVNDSSIHYTNKHLLIFCLLFWAFEIVIILLYYYSIYVYTHVVHFINSYVLCIMMRAHYLTTHSEEDTSSLSST